MVDSPMKFTEVYAGTLAYKAEGKIFAPKVWQEWDTQASPEKYAHLFRLCDKVRPGSSSAYQYHFTDAGPDEWVSLISSDLFVIAEGTFLDRVGTPFEIGDWQVWEYSNAPEFNVGSRGGVVAITTYRNITKAVADQKRREQEYRSKARNDIPERYSYLRHG